MPTNLPVPSKNALRALRHLALGTSCTLAIGAGLLTEDRRRRIHAATEVHSNKKKIKSFSNYRTGNSAQAFEDLVSRLQVEDLRRPKSPVNDTESWKSHAETVVEPEAAEIEVSEKPPEARSRVIDVDDEVFGDKLRIIFQQPSRRPKPKSRRFVGVVTDNLGRQPPKSSAQSDVKQFADVTTESQTPAIDDDPTFDKAESQKRQERLSNDVRKLLGEEPANVEAAAARFLDTLAEGLPVGKKGLLPTLIDAATQLLSALRERKLFITNNQVLDAVLLYGPLRKEDFDGLRPDRVIRSLLSHSRPEGTVDLPLNPDAIKKAASVFLTPYQEKSPLMSKPMLKLGLKLCREACDSGLYELTKEVFDYMNQCRGDNPICGVEHLILASKNSGDEEGVFRSFQELYTQAIPHELGHWKTVNLVVDSLLRLGNFQEAEGVLVVGTDMARIHNLTMSTTAILKLQGKFWRTYKDIERSQAMFDRLEPSIRVSNHPEACYGAIIQFCVEADDEPAAQLYYKSLQKAHPSRPVNIDILGHLARAKAMRQDWAGVEEDFRKIKKMAPRQYSEISASFIQILKIFALSHSIDETESFIRHFVDDLGLSITTYIMNFMVNIYAKLGEIDSISRWVEFSTRRGCQVDSVFFNTMLNQCYDSWKFNFEEIVGLHRRIQEMDQGSRFFDNDTASMMRRIQGLCHLRLTRKSVQPKTSDIFDVLVNPNTVHSNMAAAFNEGNPARTLETYVKARNDGVPPSSKHLQLAIYATLSLNAEDFASCTALIEHANRRGLDTTTHFCYLLFRQSKLLLETGEYRHGHFVEVYKKTTSRILELGKPVPIELITHAMSLMKVYSDTLPLQFWEAMACHLNLTASSLDVAGLTVFLQVYMGCDDAAGVKWTINMLSDNNLLPDMQFFQALKNEKTRLTNVSMDGAYPRAKEEYLHQILEAVRRVGDMREDHRAQKESVTHTITNILAAAIAKKYGVKRLKSEEAPVKYDEDMPLDQNGSASLWDDLVDEDLILPIPRAFGAVGA